MDLFAFAITCPILDSASALAIGRAKPERLPKSHGKEKFQGLAFIPRSDARATKSLELHR